MTTTQMSFTDEPKPPVIDDERAGRACLAMARAYPKQPAAEVVAIGIDRFRAKFGDEPTAIMTSYADAADLEGKTALRVEPKTFIAGGHFYLKRDAA